MRSTVRVSLISANASSPATGVPVLGAADAAGQYPLLAGSVEGGRTLTAAIVLTPRATDALTPFLDRPWRGLGSEDARQVALVLGAEGARAAEIARLLARRNTPEVWRWLALERATPALREAVAQGRLAAGHTRYLLGLSPADQTEWATRAARGRWSVARLGRELANRGTAAPAAATADIAQVAAALSERLGSKVEIDWPSEGARALRIEWFDVESLKGVLDQLSRGPEGGGRIGAKRELVLQLADADELAALTDHLLA